MNSRTAELKAVLPPIVEIVPGLKRKTANEMAGPCPLCGGNDRFTVDTVRDAFFCRNCMPLNPHWHDVIDFHCRIEGTDIKGLMTKYLDGPDKQENVARQVTGRYCYLDADGSSLYWKERVEPGRSGRDKEFIFYHGNRKPGRECDPVLYNLPEVLKSESLIICEGEKHCDFLKTWGLSATTLDSGAQSKPTSRMIGWLSDRRIIILRDNDSPGLSYATTLAKALHGKCKSLKVILLPGLPSKGDIIDWAKVPGNDKARLLEIIEGEQEWSLDSKADHSAAVEIIEPEIQDEWMPKAWPEIDPKAFYGVVGRAVELACRNSEADPVAVAATFLTWFGSEVGYYPGINVGDAFHSARLFVAIVGATAKARKGTSAMPIKIMRSWLAGGESQSTDTRAVARISPGPLSSGEGLIYAVRDEVRVWVPPKKNKEGSITEGFYTVTDPGEEDKRLWILDEELAGALACMKREGTTLSTTMRCAWDHGTLDPLTKSSKIRATDAHICVVTHITAEELRAKLAEVEGFSGFSNRFLWVCARRQRLVSRPEPMNELDLKSLSGVIGRALDKIKSERQASFSPETWDMWQEVYPELTRERDGLAGATVSRAEAQTVRLAMIYAFLDGIVTIEPKHLEAALAMWRYCEDSAMYIFGGRENDHLTQRILDLLAEGPKTATDIYNGIKRHKPERMREILQTLAARRKVEPVIIKTAGRDKTIFKLTGSPSAKSALSAQSPPEEDLYAPYALYAHAHREEIDEEALAERRAIQVEGVMQ